MPTLRLTSLGFHLSALLTLACLATGVDAEHADRTKPVNFAADKSEAINYETKVATLNGNVIITQGTLRIEADRMIFRQNTDNSLSATAYGKPVRFRQKLENSNDYVEGYALRAEYDGTKEVLELFDQALLKQTTDEIRSDYIYYNTATETFRAGPDAGATDTPSTASGGRGVVGTFQPKPKTDKDAETPPPANKPSTTLTPATSLELR